MAERRTLKQFAGGARPGVVAEIYGEENCHACEGEGYTFAVYGQLDTYEDCERCGGTGRVAPPRKEAGSDG